MSTAAGWVNRRIGLLLLVGTVAGLGILISGCGSTPLTQGVTGSVTDVSTGAPLAGVSVSVSSSDNESSVLAASSTLGDGSYRLDVPAGTYRVKVDDVWHPGVALFGDAAVVTVTAGAYTTVDQAVILNPGSLAGTVTDGGASPLEGVVVAAVRTDSGVSVSSTTTAVDGSYTLSNLPAGGYAARFTKPGWGTRYNGSANAIALAPVVSISAGASITGVDTVLLPAATVTGRVTNGSDPIAGATVWPLVPGGGAETYALTGADGTFTLSDLAPGDYRVFLVRSSYLSELWGTNGIGDIGAVSPMSIGSGLNPLGDNVMVGADCPPGSIHPGADLSGSDMTASNLQGCDFTGVNLTGVVLTGAHLDAAHLGASTLAAVTSGGIVGTPSDLPTGWVLLDGYLKRTQVVTITSSAPGAAVAHGATYLPTASVSSGLNPVTYTSGTPAVCTATGANGSVIAFDRPGTCTVLADQPGNLDWAPATQAQQSVTVGVGVPGFPTGLTAPLTGPGAPGEVDLAWSAPGSDGGSAILDYRIYRSINGEALTFIGTSSGALSYHDNCGVPLLRCAYRVSAINALGEGNLSAAPARTVSAVAAGVMHTCAVLDDGSVKCWGYNPYGQLGLGDTVWRGGTSGTLGEMLPPVDLGTGRTATAVRAGEYHTCALLDQGSVKCWGRNDSGQLGQGNLVNAGDGPGEMGDSLAPVDLGTGRTATAIVAGRFHTCALLDDASVKCWGANVKGMLGQGHVNGVGGAPGQMGDALPAVDLGVGRTATAIAAGYIHSCAVLDDGSVKCWGDNSAGQLGQGHTSHLGDEPGEMGDALPAVELGTGRSAVAVSSSYVHTCAVLDDASVKCWGNNEYGQLGQGHLLSLGDNPGEMGDNLPPVSLGMGRSVTALAVGDVHSCALLDDSSMKCWGHNTYGQLGLGLSATLGDNPGEMGDALPAVSLGPGRFAVVPTGGTMHTCAVLDDATLKCWGNNGYGQLGQGSTTSLGDGPGEMGANLPPVNLGSYIVWVRTQVGPQTITFTSTPPASPSANGTTYTVTATASSGLTPVTFTSATPTVCATSGSYVSVVSFIRHGTCTINANQAGNASWLPAPLATQTFTVNSGVPVAPGGITAVLTGPGAAGEVDVSWSPPSYDGGSSIVSYKIYRKINTGPLTYIGTSAVTTYHDACGVPRLHCGYVVTAVNAMGESAQSPPVTRTAEAVAVGGGHTCALLGDGSVKCWGDNTYGALGQGHNGSIGGGPNTMGDNLPPVNLGTGRTAVAITAGTSHVCALLDNSTVKCWGAGFEGALGRGASTGPIGDAAGEMGDALPAINLGSNRTPVAISAAGRHSCALLDDGTVKCWGANWYGQLGQGHTSSLGDGPNEMGDNLLPVQLGTGRTAVAVVAGASGYTCAQLDNGSVKCWGFNALGQLGQGSKTYLGDDPGELGDSLPAVDLGSGRTATMVVSGGSHNCALLDDSSVKCWGVNSDGQLGLGHVNAMGDDPGEMGDLLPTLDFGTGRSVSMVGAGANCAVLDDTTTKCWGANGFGLLGLGHVNDMGDNPGEMGDALPVVDLGTGRTALALAYGCGLLDNGRVKCWGSNYYGRLGLGDMADRGDGLGEMGDALPAVQLGTGPVTVTTQH